MVKLKGFRNNCDLKTFLESVFNPLFKCNQLGGNMAQKDTTKKESKGKEAKHSLKEKRALKEAKRREKEGK